MPLTYRDLIRPIPARPVNLATVAASPASPLCATCAAAIVPDRARARNGIIATSYERIDTYPEFHGLKLSGCALCRFIRKAVRRAWAARPMEERGVGPLDEDDSLLDHSWAGSVRLYNLTFAVEPLGGRVSSEKDSGDDEEDDPRRGSMITSMSLEFGPATRAVDANGEDLHEDISQVLGFKVYDSIDLDMEIGHPDTKRRLPSPRTLSDENVAMILSWVDECKLSHEECRLPSSTEAWLPTRLLDVGSDEDSQLPRIVETSSFIDRNTTYAALSHMWGDVNATPLRTMKYNYDEMKKGIPAETVPRNFLDAVRTCRQLGIRYVWIDSLCIVQDDTEEWTREATMMHDVYRNAEVTIVATSATSSHDGFLRRNISLVPAVKFAYSVRSPSPNSSLDPATTSTASIRSMTLTALSEGEKGLRHGDVDGSKWNTRAWTMQERSLSSRSVHFCENKIYFECRSCLKSEENEPERTDNVTGFKLWPRQTQPVPSPALEPGKLTREYKTWHDRWLRTIIQYSRRSMTVESDKLVAIRSIANEMRKTAPDGETYYEHLGAWSGGLERELLWYVESGIPRRVSPALKIPSWSWASMSANLGFVKGSRSGPVPGLLGTAGFQTLVTSNYSLHLWEEQPRHSLFLTGVRKRIAHLKRADDHNWDRPSFPYEVVGEDGKVFAHGVLDLDNRDNLLASISKVTLLYMHITNDQHPSGLLLLQQPDPYGYDLRPTATRIGVATVFETPGGLIDRSFAEALTLADVAIVNME